MTSTNSNEKTLLFVYGTLKRGQPHDFYIADQEFVGAAETTPGYSLWDAGIFPCLVEDPRASTAVTGELYRVNKEGITRLDFHEGAPHFYRRGTVMIIGHQEVQAYLYQRTTRFYGKLDGQWPRAQPWGWAKRFIIAIARALQHN